MASSEVVTLLIETIADYFTYMLPIIAVLSGIVFMVSFFMSVTMGLGRRTFVK